MLTYVITAMLGLQAVSLTILIITICKAMPYNPSWDEEDDDNDHEGRA